MTVRNENRWPYEALLNRLDAIGKDPRWLADRLKIGVSTVYHWRRRGVPHYAMVVCEMELELQAVRKIREGMRMLFDG